MLRMILGTIIDYLHEQREQLFLCNEY